MNRRIVCGAAVIGWLAERISRSARDFLGIEQKLTGTNDNLIRPH